MSWSDHPPVCLSSYVPAYGDAIDRLGIMAVLRMFDPHVAGTLPLGLGVPGSDIDIVCHAPDPAAFAATLWMAFGEQDGFSLRQWVGKGRTGSAQAGVDRPVIADFRAYGWTFEIFGQAVPVQEQAGWLHFEVEQRLLTLGGEPFRQAIFAARQRGAKTEPAFAESLGLTSDPYAAMLRLAAESDAVLTDRLIRAGWLP